MVYPPTPRFILRNLPGRFVNCWHCNTQLIWGGDHDYEDYGSEGEGIVTNLSCPECGAFVLVYLTTNKEKENTK